MTKTQPAGLATVSTETQAELPKVQIDSLVRGQVGNLDRQGEGRVYGISPFGWVSVIDHDGNQLVLHDAEVLGPPRPMKQRTDIPERLQR